MSSRTLPARRAAVERLEAIVSERLEAVRVPEVRGGRGREPRVPEGRRDGRALHALRKGGAWSVAGKTSFLPCPADHKCSCKVLLAVGLHRGREATASLSGYCESAPSEPQGWGWDGVSGV